MAATPHSSLRPARGRVHQRLILATHNKFSCELRRLSLQSGCLTVQPKVCFGSVYDGRRRPMLLIGDAQASVLSRLLSAQYRSDEHTSELQSLMRISYAVFCLKKKNNTIHNEETNIL